MKKENKILAAFILNSVFCVFELIGGSLTGSTAIISDAVHDMGDAISIGVSYLLERKAGKAADEKNKERYSLIGAILITAVLIVGSLVAICNAVYRILNPVPLNYDGMLVFAVVGVIVNSVAAVFTHGGENMNIRAVNLHMLEDVLGWVTVLIGAAAMKVTDFALIDPLMSIGVAVFILASAVKNLSSGGHSHHPHHSHHGHHSHHCDGHH